MRRGPGSSLPASWNSSWTLVLLNSPKTYSSGQRERAVPAGTAPGVTLLEDEKHLVRAVEERGYRRETGGSFFEYLTRNLQNLRHARAPTLPPGFTARAVTSDEAGRRAALHRAAWSLLPFADGERQARSRITTKAYRALMQTPPYRAELDLVVQAPDGALAASCCAWLDDENRVVELEPVGTVPEYRGLGLGETASLAALRAARGLGAERAVVYARGDDEYPVPKRLYTGMGFAPCGRTRSYTRVPEDPSGVL